MTINLEEIWRKAEEWQQNKIEVFPQEFKDSLETFIYECSGLETLAKKANYENLFKKCNLELKIPPIFKYLEDETKAENQRFQNTTFAVYSFNENDVVKAPLRIDITCKKNDIPEHLKNVLKDGKKPLARIDIEFFEKASLIDDSKNLELQDIIKDYLVDGNWTKKDVEELGNLKALEDLEKIHTEFLIYEDESIVPIYIGIGNNQPYNISEKVATYGKNRFYRYDLLRSGGKAYEQTSKVVPGKIIDFSNQPFKSPESTASGQLFALHFDLGVTILSKNVWRKAMLIQQLRDLDLKTEIEKSTGLDFLKGQLEKVFPEFDSYSQVFYDPIERTNSYTHLKTIKYLKKKGLLGLGWQAKINVASDLYLNGHDPILRIKPSLILMYHMIDSGKFSELILNTVKNKETLPFDNK